MRPLEPEVRTASNSIYAELVCTGTAARVPGQPITSGANAAGCETRHAAFTQAHSSTMEPKKGSGREEKKTAVPPRGKILQFAGKMRASDFGGVPDIFFQCLLSIGTNRAGHTTVASVFRLIDAALLGVPGKFCASFSVAIKQRRSSVLY
jgi:hypothetical protein